MVGNFLDKAHRTPPSPLSKLPNSLTIFDEFWISGFFFMDFWDFFGSFWDFFLDFLDFFWDFWIFLDFLDFLDFFWTKKALAEGRSPPQELEVGPRSGPYLLVLLILKMWISPKGGGSDNVDNNVLLNFGTFRCFFWPF